MMFLFQEHSLTYEVLRKVSPLEADLLRDPVIQARVRFRYGELEGFGFVVVAFYIFFKFTLRIIQGKRDLY